MTGQRKSVKIFGAIDLWKVRFHYQRDCVFNAETYLAFLKSLARRYRRQGAILIHDSASYHKKPLVQSWVDANQGWLEVQPLPKYSPRKARPCKNSIPRNAFGNILERTARIIATLKAKVSWKVP